VVEEVLLVGSKDRLGEEVGCLVEVAEEGVVPLPDRLGLEH